jgi:L-threonylcarbamoyladenylate synthase
MNVIGLQKLNDASTKKTLSEAIKSGKIFVYPTDTVYGLGCDAANADAVKKICQAKNRPANKPFSIIAPSKEWIAQNTSISEDNMKFVDSLFPGPYTIIVKAKSNLPKCILSDKNTVGIRIPKNEFTDFIRAQNVLFITTSVNLSEEDPVKELAHIPENIKKITDYAIDAGLLDSPSSRIFDLSGKEMKIVRY